MRRDETCARFSFCSDNLSPLEAFFEADGRTLHCLNSPSFLPRFRFRVLFVHLIPCTMLVVLNILLFRTMKEAERKRERLLNCRQKKAAAGESKESKKLRDSNCTTLMLIVVITVRKEGMAVKTTDISEAI